MTRDHKGVWLRRPSHQSAARSGSGCPESQVRLASPYTAALTSPAGPIPMRLSLLLSLALLMPFAAPASEEPERNYTVMVRQTLLTGALPARLMSCR